MTPKRISLLNPLLLIHLVGNNNLLFIKPTKWTKTTKEIFGTMVGKNRVKAKTFLQQVSMPLFRGKKTRENYPKSFVIITMRKVTIQQSVGS